MTTRDIMKRFASALLLCSALLTENNGVADGAEYVVTNTMQGDALEQVTNDFPQVYGIYDVTKGVTLVYNQVVTPPPTPSPTFSPVSSILPNWDFESGSISPWNANGDVNVAVVLDADRGSNVGVVTGRSATANWHGIGQDATGLFQEGEDYNVEISAKLTDAADGVSTPFKLTLQITFADDTRSWQSLFYTGSGLTNQWQTFQAYYGPFQPSASVKALRVFAEGPTDGLSFAIDDVKITPDLTTPSPTQAPTAAPTQPDHLVDASMNTERVVIPQPPPADLSANTARSSCPHDDPTLIDWNTQFSSPLTEGQDITIPAGTHILVSESITTKLGYITIPDSSSLVIGEDPVNGISIDANGIDVQGSLIAGSETCRIQSQITITLHGSRPDTSQPFLYKGIAVTGTLSLHGKRFYRTWTRLAKRAHTGENFLYLQDEVNWEPGQELVLVTTALRDSRDWHENEVLVIDRIETANLPSSEVKSVVYLTSTIQYDHIARPEYQTEVGLLTRTIKVQGSATDSQPTDTSPSSCQLYDHNGSARSVFGYDQVTCPNTYLTGYGGHIVMYGSGMGFVEGVELFRMGQTNFMGRYPIHFHILGDNCPGCYFKDSSVHESYYRCISVHATNGITVSENVAYDVTGFCYYLEDGVEEYNTLSYNLAAHIHFIGSPGRFINSSLITIKTLEQTAMFTSTTSLFLLLSKHSSWRPAENQCCPSIS